jgi:Pyruvate/2-oxoacid:ferredoxin oxidoreductase gamma subunit
MSVDAFQGYCNSVRPEGVIFYVEGLVSLSCDYSGPRTICVPALRVADELGSRLIVNMVTLGVLLLYSGLVDLCQLGEVVRERFPRHAAVNLKALKKGREAVMNLRIAV